MVAQDRERTVEQRTPEDPRQPALLEALPRIQRVRLLSGRGFWRTVPIPALGIESIFLSDGPHGLRKQMDSGDHLGIAESLPATCYPPAATLACSWDVELLAEIGAAIGREARSLGVSVVLGPGLNIKRHPNCGRNFEYFSEDPLLSGRLAAAMVRGLQSQGVAACLKHFAVNNQESYRMVVDVIVDERSLREIYLRGFEIAVRESQPWTVMAAYNRVNGEYCTDSRRLLTDLLRDEWGFDGLVMSDWTATNDRIAGVRAGMDLEMPSSGGAFDADVLAALERGDLSDDEVNRCGQRLIDLVRRTAPGRAPFAAGAADPAQFHALARRAAAQCTVLLKNDGTLPLAPGGRFAVIGAMAQTPRFQGAGSSQVNPTRIDNALQTLRQRLGADAEIEYSPGYDAQRSAADHAALSAAVDTARRADTVLLFAGLPAAYESEGFDRQHMRLPQQQERLIAAVCAANPRTVVVLSNGAPIEMPWAERPAALVETYLGGQAGGAAAVDVLFGDVDPSGRLAETFPIVQSDVAADAHFPGEPRQVVYGEGLFVGYRYFDSARVPVRFPFGYGLSYTSFAYGQARLSAAAIQEGEAVTLTVPVRNTGQRSGAEVVQVYVRRPGSALVRPDKELRGFGKVWLAAGETQEVSITLGARAFAYYDVESSAWQVEAGEFEVLVGSSSAHIHTTETLSVKAASEASKPSSPQALAPDSRTAAFATATDLATRLGRPLPVPEPAQPFHRNSTFEDLSQTPLGRLVQWLVLRTARQQTARLAGGDLALQRMFDRATLEAPLRAATQASAGRISLAVVDAVIDALNQDWLRLLRRLGRRHAPK